MSHLFESEIPTAQSPPPAPSPARLVVIATLFYGLIALVAWGWRSGLAGEPLLYANEAARSAGVHWPRDLAAGLGAGLLLVWASRVWTRRTQAGTRLAQGLRALLGRLGTPTVAWLALVSGAAEEALFRGALQPQVGLVIASLLFGLAHFAPRRELAAWAPAAVIAGFALGGLYAWTGNLVAPVVAHATVNAINLRWLGGDEPFSAPGA